MALNSKGTQMLKLKNLSRKLALKYAAFPPTLPSAPGLDGTSPNIPRAPRVPIIEEVPMGPESDFEVKTPKLDMGLAPMSSEMFNDPSSGNAVTMRPEELMKMSPYQEKLIAALDSMHMNNLITSIHYQKSVQEIQRSTHDAHLYPIYKDIKETLEKAELHALNYAKKMQKIILSID